MVGTRPTDRPSRRHFATVSRSRAAVATTAGRALVTAVSSLFADHGQAAGVAVLGIRKGPRLNLRRIATGGVDDEGPELSELFHEARLAVAPAQAQHVVDDEHLAIALDPGADSDRRNGECLGDLG